MMPMYFVELPLSRSYGNHSNQCIIYRKFNFFEIPDHRLVCPTKLLVRNTLGFGVIMTDYAFYKQK